MSFVMCVCVCLFGDDEFLELILSRQSSNEQIISMKWSKLNQKWQNKKNICIWLAIHKNRTPHEPFFLNNQLTFNVKIFHELLFKRLTSMISSFNQRKCISKFETFDKTKGRGRERCLIKYIPFCPQYQIAKM